MPLSTSYTLHCTPPASPARDIADSTQASMVENQAELLFLRQRNQELQSQLDELTIANRGDSSCPKSHEENVSLDQRGQVAESTGVLEPQQLRSVCVQLEENSHSETGLHHRRISRKDSDSCSFTSTSPHSPGRRFSLLKPKPSAGSFTHATKDHEYYTVASPSKKTSESKPTEVVSSNPKEISFDNESSGTKNNPKSMDTKKSPDGCGRYMKALSIDHGDEEEGHAGPVPVPHTPSHDGSEDSHDLIDDDSSHNKHIPRILSGAPISLTSAESNIPRFRDQLKERSGWLIGLLFLQSCSSFIIQYNERFLKEHMVIVQFLTMLVGAGGNAGNQASVGVIRSLAVGTLNANTMKSFLTREAKMAVCLSALIGTTGFIRAAIFRTPPGETIAVTASVFAIVAISVGIGSTLPLGMKKVGIDPAHSSTSIQVIMDILGVLITVCVSSFVLSFKMFQTDDT